MGETTIDEGLSVAQMASETGVSGHTLRYYERAGLIHAIERTSGNQRRYRAGDIEWVRFLLRLRNTGMGIAQMRSYAQMRAVGDTTLEARMAMLKEHDEAVSWQVELLRVNRLALREKIVIYQNQIESRRTEKGLTDER